MHLHRMCSLKTTAGPPEQSAATQTAVAHENLGRQPAHSIRLIGSPAACGQNVLVCLCGIEDAMALDSTYLRKSGKHMDSPAIDLDGMCLKMLCGNVAAVWSCT